MSRPTVNSIPWQNHSLVITLQDKQEGLNIMRGLSSRMPHHYMQYRFLENLNDAATLANQAIIRMMSQRNPK